MDKIRNEYIRGTAQVGRFGEKTREARLRWYGHVLRKDDGYIGRSSGGLTTGPLGPGPQAPELQGAPTFSKKKIIGHNH